ncbi:MAG: electron transfer flavoprotein subunit alpha/FixB family protein [Desulfotignum sp.]
MKAAIVLVGDAPHIARQAADMAGLVSALADGISALDLWLIHTGRPPGSVPQWDVPLSHIYLMKTSAPFLPEQLLDMLSRTVQKCPKDLYFFGSATLSQTLAVRMGYRLKGSFCSQVETCTLQDKTSLVAGRSVYGSHMQAQFLLDKKPWCLSAARTAGSLLKSVAPGCPVTDVPCDGFAQPGWLKSVESLSNGEAQVSVLEGAARILVLGNGISTKKKLDRIMPVAGSLDAEIAASRPVVMNGWLPMDRLIGVSGAVVSPALCIVAGVSGTGVFSAGIKNAQFIVAINTDPDAPVFKKADVGIVDDLTAVLSALDLLIRERKKNG